MSALVGNPVIPSYLSNEFISPTAMISPSPASRVDTVARLDKPSEPAVARLVNWTREVRQQVHAWVPMVQVTTERAKPQPDVETKTSVAQKAAAQCSNEVQALQPIVASKRGYHVEVRGTTIAVLPTRKLADQLADQLKPIFDREGFVPEAPYPAVIEQHPGATIGDRVLFTVDAATARALHQSADLIAIQWVNGLRQALDMAPLPLADAQEHLHGLAPTHRTLAGTASWYGPYFHGRLTANGETFDQKELTAAHPTLPFGTYLKVTNVISGGSVIVRINDRGPYVGRRSLDLSRAAAKCIGSERRGVVPYEAVILTQTQTAQAKPKGDWIARIPKSADAQ